jgi:hypothetical protein
LSVSLLFALLGESFHHQRHLITSADTFYQQVKAQRQGTVDCPLCRRPNAVKLAAEENVDVALMAFLRQWFPTETCLKKSSDEKERRMEELQDLGYHQRDCITH